MAKKVRRVRQPARESSPPSAPEPTRSSARATSRAGGSRRASGARGPATTVDDLREEYAYVLRDLRRVFILALSMFALLIALNLFFR